MIEVVIIVFKQKNSLFSCKNIILVSTFNKTEHAFVLLLIRVQKDINSYEII